MITTRRYKIAANSKEQPRRHCELSYPPEYNAVNIDL
ncbi:MAG: hypothetical protein K0R24_50 [Gammaproteobacteria bacterium]|nr:hypothetical protein [Gammaproteobacteria bacterium]